MDRRLSHFPGCAEGPSRETEAFPERTLVMSTKITTTTPPTEKYNKEQGWNKNTELCVNLKTILHSDRKMKVGKDYQGVLRLDQEGTIDEFLSRDPHYTFIETLPWSMKRNPRVFNGKYISVTRQDDGTYRLNFKPMPKLDTNLSFERYTFGVYLELHKGLKCLIEK